MNYIKNTLTIMVLFISGSILHAQNQFLDSLRIEIDKTMEIELATNDYDDLNKYLEEDLKNLQRILKESKSIPTENSYTINYSPNNSVTIKQSTQNERIIWEDNQLILIQFSKKCIVKSEHYYLLIRFNDIESLTSDNLIAKIKESIKAASINKNRFAATYNYAFEGNKFIHNKNLDKTNGKLDALSLKGGVGVNLIKNKPVLDLSAEVGILFSKNGKWKNNFYVGFNQLSYFDDESNIILNDFVNIGYRKNLSKNNNSQNWHGLEIGYLVNRKGDLFEKNTFKLGFNWELGKYISVSPQLYFSGDLTYPALRIGFGF